MPAPRNVTELKLGDTIRFGGTVHHITLIIIGHGQATITANCGETITLPTHQSVTIRPAGKHHC